MSNIENRYETFKAKAEAVAAVVSEVQTLEQVFDYAVTLCDQKEACRLLVSGCEEHLSEKAEELCEMKHEKVMAAPGLDEDHFKQLDRLCRDKNIKLIGSDLRENLAGIDIGLTFADYGIAETGTLVINSNSEETRLATMISEFHIAVLPKSGIRETAFELENELREWMQQPPNYTAFITGASRTADIERVLTLGVHGPLQLHILLWEDN